MSTLPIVAVVGRPNVGKSSLVNRIVGGRSAVVEEMPGVTRDRRNFEADWAGRSFILIDTGGWERDPEAGISESIKEQAELALVGADVVLFVVDARVGSTPDDEAVVRLLRRTKVPVVLVANKIDDAAHESTLADLWSLGLGEPYGVSALHGRGVGELLDRLVGLLPPAAQDHDGRGLPRLALIGRPNVGKSTLLNRLLGEERVIVSPTPGTTRDPIDVEAKIDGRPYILVDTAGIRRRPQINESADFFAVERARRVLGESDAAVVLIDGIEGVTAADQRIIDEVIEAGVSLVILLNKWDREQSTEQREDATRSVEDKLGFVSWAPMMRGSALTGARLGRLGKMIEQGLEARMRRIGTGELNRLISRWTAAHPPPVRKGRRPRIQYAVQAGVAPPTFVLFVAGGELGNDYLRFLENRLRDEVDFAGTPIRIVTRTGR
ncbi:MAG TPA: ribosome biogenesis GTPase Der [Acidimicrobiia bacterium]|nr:ribosome biogenesis GTPase Der [Acidimicrobiia bacterium]